MPMMHTLSSQGNPWILDDITNAGVYRTERVIDFLAGLNLIVNVSKTQCLFFSLKNWNNNSTININNVIITGPGSTKFLGIVFDNRLNWKAHKQVRSKQAISSLDKCLNVLTRKCSWKCTMPLFSLPSVTALPLGVVHTELIWTLYLECKKPLLELYLTRNRMTLAGNCLSKLNLLTLPALYIYQCINYVVTHSEKTIKNSRHLSIWY